MLGYKTSQVIILIKQADARIDGEEAVETLTASIVIEIIVVPGYQAVVSFCETSGYERQNNKRIPPLQTSLQLRPKRQVVSQ